MRGKMKKKKSRSNRSSHFNPKSRSNKKKKINAPLVAVLFYNYFSLLMV
jgi:hypothetical protein